MMTNEFKITPQNVGQNVAHQQDLSEIVQLGYRLEFSLANYLRIARPWQPEGTAALAATLRRVAADDLQAATHLGRLVANRHGAPWPRTYPVEFTALNDLHIRFVAKRVLDEVRTIARQCDLLRQQTQSDPELREVLALIARMKENHEERLIRELHLQPDEEPQPVRRPAERQPNGHHATRIARAGVPCSLAGATRADFTTRIDPPRARQARQCNGRPDCAIPVGARTSSFRRAGGPLVKPWAE